jgi:Trypsin
MSFQTLRTTQFVPIVQRMKPILILLTCHLVAAFDPRVVGGPEADIDRFPFMAALYKLKENQFHCSGSIIHVNWILTAGHCKRDANLIGVRVGSSFASHDGQTYRASKFIAHERYVKGVLNAYDIALLKTTELIKRSRTVQTVRLPKANADFKVGFGCMVSAFGRTGNEKLDAGERRLRYLGMPILPQKECSWMGRFSEETMICAGFIKTQARTCRVRVGWIQNILLKTYRCFCREIRVDPWFAME